MKKICGLQTDMEEGCGNNGTVSKQIYTASQSCRHSCNKSPCPACEYRSRHSCTHARRFSEISIPKRHLVNHPFINSSWKRVCQEKIVRFCSFRKGCISAVFFVQSKAFHSGQVDQLISPVSVDGQFMPCKNFHIPFLHNLLNV